MDWRWMGGLVVDYDRIGGLVMEWRRIGGLVTDIQVGLRLADWRWIGSGLATDWRTIGDGLAIDWHVGNGLADRP